MNKGKESDDNINMYCDKHKQIFTEMDNAYRCMRTLKITDNLISKRKIIFVIQCYCGDN